MRKRLILFPGYGEDARAFEQLLPFLQDFDIVHVDYRQVLPKIPFTKTNSHHIARLLIAHYRISPFDRLVGHSMGGYFSCRIREIMGNDICMIGSFSDPARIIHTTPVPHLTPLFVATGFSKSIMARQYLQKRVAGKPHEAVMMGVVDNFRTFRNQDLAKLALITLEKKRPSKYPNPLRIHAEDDRVVRPPDEDFVKVPGGHFCINLYPKEVADAMHLFLH